MTCSRGVRSFFFLQLRNAPRPVEAKVNSPLNSAFTHFPRRGSAKELMRWMLACGAHLPDAAPGTAIARWTAPAGIRARSGGEGSPSPPSDSRSSSPGWPHSSTTSSRGLAGLVLVLLGAVPPVVALHLAALVIGAGHEALWDSAYLVSVPLMAIFVARVMWRRPD